MNTDKKRNFEIKCNFKRVSKMHALEMMIHSFKVSFVGVLFKKLIAFFSFCSETLFQNHVPNAPKANNWLLHSLLVILLVYSVPLYLIQLMLSYQNWTKLRARLPSKWPRSLDFSVCGTVWCHVSLWSVHWPVCNGSSMMVLKLVWPFHVHHPQRCQPASRPNWLNNKHQQKLCHRHQFIEQYRRSTSVLVNYSFKLEKN